jgi:hypothetical protein
VVDLLRGLPHQEQATGDQDEIPPGEALAEGREERLGQLNDDGNCPQQAKTQNKGKADADAPCPRLLMGGQLIGDDGDEDQVVDTEHDLHYDKGRQGGPGCRVSG